MTHTTRFTAAEILAIPEDEPEKLFSRPDTAKHDARVLFKAWHPDHCSDPRADEVFHRLRVLAEAAERKIEAGTWEVPGLLRVRSTAGAEFEVRYARKLALEVGTMYVSKTLVGFDIQTDNLDLLASAEAQWSALTYATPAMRAEFERYFPAVMKKVETATGAFLVLRKDPGVLLLDDVLAYYKGAMPPRHVAWVISRLLNIACFLEVQGKLSHNAIGPDTVFISPAQHTAHLLGGWWFATGLGTRLTAASQRMVRCAPPDVLQKKVGDSRTDMEMIKALGRELLGDPTGVRLAKDSAVPPALVTWLQLSTHQSAVATYKDWQERVLIEAFGQRKFVPMDVTHDMLY
ncbi:hypothetical protein KTD31_02125 [Burkholderia multivorans]|jgi:hypothetical protein|uniref:hypothetical protein n=1 Tax=Burkholderia multivorans TaxID=87883 RepID=UPI001C2417BF|nr:hypothetical protein [Burkholderia multivorans]MBU9200202.1 hypothetical protein [Burkholderia multivorans]